MKHGHNHRRLPPAVRYVLWFVFFTQMDKARPRFIVDCVVYTVIILWVTVVWENGAENSGMGALMCMTKVVKNDAQLWLMNWFKKSTNACVEKRRFTISELSEEFLQNSRTTLYRIVTDRFGLPYVLCTVGSKNDWLTWLRNLAAPFFEEGLQILVSRYDKCLNEDGNYVEK